MTPPPCVCCFCDGVLRHDEDVVGPYGIAGAMGHRDCAIEISRDLDTLHEPEDKVEPDDAPW